MEGLTLNFVLNADQLDMLNRVLQLLLIMSISAVASGYYFRDKYSCSGIIVWAIAMFGSLYLLDRGSALYESALATYLLSAVFGASTGAMLGGYTKLQHQKRVSEGKDTTLTHWVMNLLVVVGGSTFVAALVGLYSGYNFQTWRPYMFVGIGFVFVVIFVQLMYNIFTNRENEIARGIIETGLSGLVSIFWVIYMIVDFNMLTSENLTPSWNYAAHIAAQIFLDMANLYIWLQDFL